MNKFWMVLVKGGSKPKVKHPSFEVAETEARRLAILLPHAPVYVLEAVLEILPTAIPIIETPQEKKSPVVIIKKTRKAIVN